MTTEQMTKHGPVETAQRVAHFDVANLFIEFPGAIRAITERKVWQTRMDKNGEPFQSFREFVEHPLPRGLGVSLANMIAYCEDDPEAIRAIRDELPDEAEAPEQTNPTTATYFTIETAYGYLNDALFDGRLPMCLVTFQRKNGAKGYFYAERFRNLDDDEITDEIALNPQAAIGRTHKETLSTLAHEMVHLWQHHFGKPGRGSYHNREWVHEMERIGLVPSDTGEPGGKQTGDRVTHYIVEGGPFDRAADDMLDQGFHVPYIDAEKRQPNQSKTKSKTRHTCPQCQQNAWAKADANLMCGECEVRMVATVSSEIDSQDSKAA